VIDAAYFLGLVWSGLVWSESMAYAVGGVCDGAGAPPVGTVQSTYADAVFQPGVPLAVPLAAGALAVGDAFGTSIAVADFNGDSIDDIAVGAPGANHGALVDVGAVMVFFGQVDMQPLCATTGCLPSQVTTRAPDVLLWGEVANAKFGTSLASAGDLNPVGGPNGHAVELLIGGNGYAMVVDVQLAAAAGQYAVANALAELTPDSGSTTTRFGHLVGSMEVEGVRVLWVGEALGHALHVYTVTGPRCRVAAMTRCGSRSRRSRIQKTSLAFNTSPGALREYRLVSSVRRVRGNRVRRG